MRSLDRVLSLNVAAWLCAALAVGSVALAFLGPERSGALMSRPPLLAFTAVLACGLTAAGVRAASRRRFDSALLHLGCACVMAGWLVGRIAIRTATPDRPAGGAMALVAGNQTDALCDGEELNNVVGRVPFTVRLERFLIDRYPPSEGDRDEGRMPPVKEYRSRVTITEPGEAPYVRNIRVNHPAYVRGYHIYQMSWGESRDRFGRPMLDGEGRAELYTVLQFVRDPGLPAVYAGFAVLFAGALLFACRLLRRGPGEAAAPGQGVTP